jgi:hypothetical protein
MLVSQAVRYDAVNAMLREFLKEHRKVEKLEATSPPANATRSVDCGSAEGDRTDRND